MKVGHAPYGLAFDVVGLVVMMSTGAAQASRPSDTKVWTTSLGTTFNQVLEDSRIPDAILANYKVKVCLRVPTCSRPSGTP